MTVGATARVMSRTLVRPSVGGGIVLEWCNTFVRFGKFEGKGER